MTVPYLMRRAMGRHIKLIVMLRDPVDRLHAAFWAGDHYQKKYGADEAGFGLFAVESMKEWHRCLREFSEKECVFAYEALSMQNEDVFFHCDQIIKSIYVPFVEGWVEAFHRNDILFIRLEDYIKDTKLILGSVMTCAPSLLFLYPPFAHAAATSLPSSAALEAAGKHPVGQGNAEAEKPLCRGLQILIVLVAVPLRALQLPHLITSHHITFNYITSAFFRHLELGNDVQIIDKLVAQPVVRGSRTHESTPGRGTMDPEVSGDRSDLALSNTDIFVRSHSSTDLPVPFDRLLCIRIRFFSSSYRPIAIRISPYLRSADPQSAEGLLRTVQPEAGQHNRAGTLHVERHGGTTMMREF